MLVPLLSTFAVQAVVAAAMFGVAVLAPLAAAAIGVDATLIGAFTAIAYGFGMGAGLLTGALTRRYGAVRLCQGTMLATAGGIAVLVLSTPLAAIASAVFLGLGYGPVNPATTDILTRVSTARRRPLVLSAKQTATPAGAALAGALLPGLAVALDWRAALGAVGVLAVVVGVAAEPLRRRLEETGDASAKLRAGSVADPVGLIWREPRLRRLAVTGFVYAGCQVALASYYVVYLSSELLMALTAAGLVYTAMQLSAVAGRLLWGTVADWLLPGNRVLVGLGLVVGVVMVGVGLCTRDSPTWLIVALTVLVGATSHGWNGVFFAELAKVTPRGRIGEAAGGIQFASLAGVASVPPLFAAAVLVGGYRAAFGAVALAMVVAGMHLWRGERVRPARPG